MTYNDFISRVSEKTGLDMDKADNAVRAFLGVLAERLPAKEVRDLASQLPKPLQGYMWQEEPLLLKHDEGRFYERISEQEGIDKSLAQDHAKAVWETLDETVQAGQMGDMLERLPNEVANYLRS